MTSTSPRAPTPIPLARLVVILGMLAAFAPFATDMYLPAFQQMAGSFGVGAGGIESTLSVFFLGLALGQAIHGPLIDRFGRRRPLLAGIAVYLVATVVCATTSDLGVFTGARLLQAMGGCAGMIIGRVIVSDLFDPQEGARVLSLLMMVMTLAPISAPVLGGLILTTLGWRMIFAFLFAFGLLCAVLVWRFLPETLPPERRRPLSAARIAGAYGRLIRRPAFIVPALVGGLAQACMFAYITGSPGVFIGIHHVSAQQYGWLFASVAVGLILAAQGNRMGLKRRTPATLLGRALMVNVAGGLILLALVAAGAGLAELMVPLWFAIASLGFITANAAATAMAASGEERGSGSALVGVLQFGCASLVSSLVAATHNGTAYPMALAIVCAGLAATLLWFGSRSLRARSAAQPV
jgi:DHA1 family bicyclomycin/chloramphenicol resistance-like MFS transporter